MNLNFMNLRTGKHILGVTDHRRPPNVDADKYGSIPTHSPIAPRAYESMFYVVMRLAEVSASYFQDGNLLVRYSPIRYSCSENPLLRKHCAYAKDKYRLLNVAGSDYTFSEHLRHFNA